MILGRYSHQKINLKRLNGIKIEEKTICFYAFFDGFVNIM